MRLVIGLLLMSINYSMLSQELPSKISFYDFTCMPNIVDFNERSLIYSSTETALLRKVQNIIDSSQYLFMRKDSKELGARNFKYGVIINRQNDTDTLFIQPGVEMLFNNQKYFFNCRLFKVFINYVPSQRANTYLYELLEFCE